MVDHQPNDNTPDSSIGPLVNLLAPLGVLATRSDDVKHIAQNFGVDRALPWATWFRGLMSWNRTVRR